MLMSVVMSAPGPLILGIGLLLGRSNTQIADFLRRSIELLAIIMSFIAYRITVKRELNPQETQSLERRTNLFVGGTMLLAGVVMLCITLFSEGGEKGNVVFALVIAVLGVTANSIFWIRYKRLSRAENSAILEVQSRLYRAKTFVDICVTAALLSVLIAPQSQVSYYFDKAGSAVVSVYLAYSGIKIISEQSKKQR